MLYKTDREVKQKAKHALNLILEAKINHTEIDWSLGSLNYWHGYLWQSHQLVNPRMIADKVSNIAKPFAHTKDIELK